MTLRIFPVAGDALNFGGRRLETIARISWLPVALILLANMVTVFAYLSVIAGRPITFADVATFTNARQLLGQLAAQGWSNNATAMSAITFANIVVQAVLAASFMAPLVRYAGVGEKPGPGLLKLAFGPDQLRFLFAGFFSGVFVFLFILKPMASATYYSVKYVIAAMKETKALFPDENSLHTIQIVTSADWLASQGSSWVYNLAVPLVAAAPFALLLWALLFIHFSARRGFGFFAVVARLATTLVLVVAGSALLYFYARSFTIPVLSSGLNLNDPAVATAFSQAPVNIALFTASLIFALVSYFNLRLLPYQGLAVCRRTLAPTKMLPITRGWNLVRLLVIVAIVYGLLAFIQTVIINRVFLGVAIPAALNTLLAATQVSTKLVNSGVTAEWVYPTFIWIWNAIKIGVNILWAMFSFGVAAGLYGRLYREGERIA